MNYLSFILIFFVISFLMIGQELYKSDIEFDRERDIYNYTEETIIIPPSNISSLHPIEQTKGIINQGRLYLILESGVNFLFVSAEQVMKMGIEYGYQNPDINYDKIFKYLVILLIVILIYLLIKPVGYLIVFIIMIVIMIKDKVKKRKMKPKQK